MKKDTFSVNLTNLDNDWLNEIEDIFHNDNRGSEFNIPSNVDDEFSKTFQIYMIEKKIIKEILKKIYLMMHRVVQNYMNWKKIIILKWIKCWQ